ncbi:probable glycoprotein hormone G-protein coupled receptor [Actinia tenebrosa]|uniref:Probable glycoprotein hormone G-protein coupled receptor n=1 Tax=Actinia tenebrosa TaxID=6105 RepID=A0A6P8HKC6_ACTTE|nr:probable glycoprotein hormone G-protein coupled receptor [Actinia tenebrosa]
MVCRIKEVREVQTLILEPKNVSSFSLANNNIQTLSYEAFCGLNNLTVLNISMNPIHTSTGNITGLFPSLSLLDATGIVDWKPEKHLFQLRMLQQILHLTWSRDCQNCIFYRANDTYSTEYSFINLDTCYVFYYNATNLSPIVRFLSNTSFKVRECLNTDKCQLSRYRWTRVKTENHCWEETVLGMNLQSCLGYLGALVNLVVISNILASKILRKNISMLFVCNMAVSDFILSIFTIIITVFLNSVSFAFVDGNAEFFCWKVGFLWMLGQGGAVITSFSLTLERYLVIVYSLNPDIRITRKMAAILIVVCWIVALLITAYALYFNFYKYTFVCIPLRFQFDPRHFHVSMFAFVVGAIAIILYLISFAFYIHIFITVRKAAQNAGVKRESKLAKRIALLVFSNVFFFVLPALILAAAMVFGLHLKMVQNTDKVVFELIAKVLPVFSLSLNSFLNPFLHAFRNDRFTQALKERFRFVRQEVRSILPERFSTSTRVRPETRTTKT